MLRFLVCALVLTATASAQSFQQDADPFPFASLSGSAFPDPFVGGVLEPKPALVNLIGDETAELVINAGGAGLQMYALEDGVWRLKDHRLGGVTPNTWATFGDLDQDGDEDLLVRGQPGRVMHWRNVGTAEAPEFELSADELVDVADEPVRIEDSSQPALADIDGDGDLDLLAGKADLGTITLYQNVGMGEDGHPLFEFVTDTFQDIAIYEDSPSCTTARPPTLTTPGRGPNGTDVQQRHGANAISLPDLDGDDAPELFWGDFFAQSLFYFRNAGTSTSPNYVLESESFPVAEPLLSGGYNASTFGDADGDGDLDLMVGVLRGLCFAAESVTDNLIKYENKGTASDPDFELQTSRLIQTFDVGARSTAAFGDLDGDGDLDMVVGNEAAVDGQTSAVLTLVRNEGTAEAPSFRVEAERWIGLDYDFGGYAPLLEDLDADGDLDLLVGGFNGRFAYIENTGNASSPQFSPVPTDERFQGVDTGQYARATMGDIDGDGDLDLVTGASSGRVRVYRNTGSVQDIAFGAEANGTPLAEDLTYGQAIGLPEDVGEDSAPTLADIDGDGDLDLMIGTAIGPILIYRNVGTSQAPSFQEAGALQTSRRRVVPVLVDLVGDDRVELVAGSNAGGLLYWAQGDGTSSADPAAIPSNFGLQVFPNPSSGSITVRTPNATEGDLVVYDAQGRSVRQLEVKGRETEWDGRSASGERVPSGVYLVQLRTGRRVAMAAAVRI
ncbi:MAG: T9SS type A sorting domain-containing protein [Bacteroidota bacterium]